MGLLSIFQRNKQTAAKPAKSGRAGKAPVRQAPHGNSASAPSFAAHANPADTAEAVREARARARRRLMGATVLLVTGVILFPLLFETQPRPIPVDLPIEIPARNAPGVVDASSHAGTRSVATLAANGPTASAAASRVTESVSYDARPSAATPASAAPSTPSAPRSALASLAAALTPATPHSSDAAASPAAASSTVAQSRPAARPVKPAAASSPAAPLAAASRPSPAAILADAPETKPSDTAGGVRFVVQVGAFLDDAKVRETRAKVEKLGLKTYTQPVDTPTGKRIRVRVGPYGTKADADKIAARLKSDGLQAVVLTL